MFHYFLLAIGQRWAGLIPGSGGGPVHQMAGQGGVYGWGALGCLQETFYHRARLLAFHHVSVGASVDAGYQILFAIGTDEDDFQAWVLGL